MGVPYVKFKITNPTREVNTFDTYGLILSSQEIGLPPVKTNYIDIEGRHGALDMSEAFDEIFYGDRTLTFTFNMVSDIYTWDELRTRIANDLHGKICGISIYSDRNIQYIGQIPFDLSPYYRGRCMVDKYQSSKGLGTIVIKCICEPFKYGWEKHVDITLGDTEITTVTETFEIDGVPTEIYCKALSAKSSYVIFKIDNEAEFAVPKLETIYYPVSIGAGQHTIQVTGQGSAQISYIERYI